MSRVKISNSPLRFGIQPDSAITGVPWFGSVGSSIASGSSAAIMPPVAMKLSMIVEITSLTPRVTLRRPARPAQRPPTVTATNKINATWIGPHRLNCEPTQAAINEARMYCPSTPMLNRFILNPTATAVADNINGVARFIISSSWLLCVPVLTISESRGSRCRPSTRASRPSRSSLNRRRANCFPTGSVRATR